jgi:hypothetical protein
LPRLPLALLPLVALVPAALPAGELDLRGAASARALVVEGQRSWIEGGYGRLTEGAESSADALPAFRGRVHLGLDWRPSPAWLFRVHGTLQGEPEASLGQTAGLVEAFAQLRADLDVRTALRVRAGLFFPPTSLENTDPLWQSPYTITLSAWNTWIGEEVRLTGLDAQLSRDLGGSRLEVAAAAFAFAEPSGALVAWRGFGMGDRLTTLGEFLPLPPLRSLERGGAFADQTHAGTRPIDELAGRVGWHARARWSHGESALVQAAWTENGGDRGLHSGQYSWDTRYGQAGLQIGLGPRAVFVAEGALGTTTMGPQVAGGPYVDVQFRTGYALVSWMGGAFRLSARADAFENRDRDLTAEPDQDSGWAVTTAGFWSPRKWIRLGVEYLVLRSDRPAAQYSGDDPDTDAKRLVGELRLMF